MPYNSNPNHRLFLTLTVTVATFRNSGPSVSRIDTFQFPIIGYVTEIRPLADIMHSKDFHLLTSRRHSFA